MPSVKSLKQDRKALQNVRDQIQREEAALAREAHELQRAIEDQHDAIDDARKRGDKARVREIKHRLAELAEKREGARKKIDQLEERDKSLVGRIRLLARRIKAKIRERRKRKKINLSSGSTHWGGSDDIIRRDSDPVAADYGAPVTSRKRSASDPLTVANPGSDHSALALLASAADYGTFSGSALAYAIARALGISGYSVGNYNGYNITVAGHVFRVQILWAVEGHFNHVHVGIRRVS